MSAINRYLISLLVGLALGLVIGVIVAEIAQSPRSSDRQGAHAEPERDKQVLASAAELAKAHERIKELEDEKARAFDLISRMSSTIEAQEKAQGATSEAAQDEQIVERAPTASPTTWTELQRWRGSGIKSTEEFRTASREWRISWKTTNESFPGAGMLQIYIYDLDKNLIDIAANQLGTGSDTSYVRSPPGDYYLQISGANLDWEVIVEHRDGHE